MSFIAISAVSHYKIHLKSNLWLSKWVLIIIFAHICTSIYSFICAFVYMSVYTINYIYAKQLKHLHGFIASSSMRFIRSLTRNIVSSVFATLASGHTHTYIRERMPTEAHTSWQNHMQMQRCNYFFIYFVTRPVLQQHHQRH